MKILLVARWPVGGIRTYIRYIYSNIVFEDCQFTLIAPDLNLRDFLKDYLPNNRIKLHEAEDDNRSIIRELRKCIKNNNYDLIHSHGFSAGALTAIATTLGVPCPHVMTAHDVYRDELFKGIKGKLKWFSLNLLYRRLDAVLTVGKDCFDNFHEYMPLVNKKNIINIDHGVDVEKFSGALKVDYRKALSLPANKKIIGFFGRFMSQKGFSDLVAAIGILAKKFDEIHMPIVLTFGWGGFVREEYENIERLGLTKYFKQMPFTDDMPSAIKGVDMVVMPSRWEACGLLAMEVLSAGVALIGTNCIGLRCVLDGSPSHMVNPNDPDALALAIEAQMTGNDVQFKEYQQVAIDRFGLDRPARELYEFYQAKAKGSSPQ